MENSDIERIVKLMRDLREIHERRIIDAGASDFAEYRFICGKIEGFRRAEAIVLDALKDAERGPD